MKGWKRITLVIFVLIGGTTSFAYWSINQFDSAFDNLSDSYLANTHLVYSSFKQNTGDETIPVITSTTTTATTTPVTATSTDLELSFVFPQKGNEVYVGCTYPISWQPTATVTSLETALIDAGTREPMGPVASGLAKESAIEKDSQNLNWKVGNVWPGAYYIKVSKINGVEAAFRSKVFEINEMSANISASEKENVCKGSGGSF